MADPIQEFWQKECVSSGGRRGWLAQSCLRPLPKPVIVGLLLQWPGVV